MLHSDNDRRGDLQLRQGADICTLHRLSPLGLVHVLFLHRSFGPPGRKVQENRDCEVPW